MLRSLWVVIIILILVTACASATQTAPFPSIQNATFTPSPLPTDTNTSIPTETPTASITPLPTIPTFTPTFDARTIVTVTPAPKAECPKENSTLKLDGDFQSFDNPGNDILDFLNKGGASKTVISEINKASLRGYPFGLEEDLTNDHVPELIVATNGKLLVFGCIKGSYKVFLNWDDPRGSIYVIDIQDMNLNGLPDIVARTIPCQDGSCTKYRIYEWNGQELQIVFEIGAGVTRVEKVEDINNDEVFEFLFTDGVSAWLAPEALPNRLFIHSVVWNGSSYILTTVGYPAPEYRFQAIQDGDNAVLVRNYENASLLYYEAINNMKLEWFSLDRKKHLIDIHNSFWLNQPTPPNLPPDITEYPRLAAYAYYRIMLLHLVQGHEPEATTVYNTLGQKFGDDQYGHPYVEMATAFWNAYQSTHKMYDGCAAAIDYAVKHPEILIPLGSDYHGAQSHTYVAADMCPFR